MRLRCALHGWSQGRGIQQQRCKALLLIHGQADDLRLLNGAAGGFLPVVEALRQVTRQPIGRQVPDARIALASGYGMVTYDRCLASGAAILEGAA